MRRRGGVITRNNANADGSKKHGNETSSSNRVAEWERINLEKERHNVNLAYAAAKKTLKTHSQNLALAEEAYEAYLEQHEKNVESFDQRIRDAEAAVEAAMRELEQISESRRDLARQMKK